jgi:hypothetical protein
MSQSRISGKEIVTMLGEPDVKSVMDGIWKSSPTLQDYTDLPSSYSVGNFYDALTSSPKAMNEFVDTLITRIGLVIIKTKSLQNPLAPFKKGALPLGKTIEEVFVDLAKSVKYDLAASANDVFEVTTPDVKAYYHTRNRQDKIPATITEDNLRSAFTSWNTLGSFLANIITSMYNRNNVDEFRYMKLLLDQAIQTGNMTVVKVPKPNTPANAAQAVTTIKGISNRIEFPTREYNGAGVMTQSTKDEQDLFLTADSDAYMDVNVLASAFNMSKADFMGHKHMIDSLSSTPNLVGVLVDRDFYMVYDQLFRMTNQYNGSGLYWNYWLHVWQVMSASLFANAIAFVYEDADHPIKDVTSIVVNPATVSVAAGSSFQFLAVVKTTDDSVDKSGVWSVSNAKSTTTVDKTGKVSVGSDETVGTAITVTFKSNHKETDGTYTSGSATLTIK